MIHPIAWFAGQDQPNRPTGLGLGSQTINGLRRCLAAGIFSLDLLVVAFVLSGTPEYGLIVSIPAGVLCWMLRNLQRREQGR